MDRVAICRTSAMECLALAKSASDPAHKRLLVKMAALYQRVALLESVIETPAVPQIHAQAQRPRSPPAAFMTMPAW